MGGLKGGWRLAGGCLLLAAFCLLGAYALSAQQRAATRGLDLGSPINRANTLYGVNIHLLSDPGRGAALASLKAQGFGWVRQEIDWQTADWADVDALTQATSDAGLQMVAALTGSAPPDPVAFGAYAGEFAERFGSRVTYYQIWDEPNLEIGWAGPPSAAQYARLLQAAHVAIHQVDREAVVVLAGLAPTVETGPKNISDVLYLRQLYALGAAAHFDAAAGKPYGFNQPPGDRTVDEGVLNFSRLILLREEMVAQGDTEKFLLGTNFGWNTRPSIWGQVTPEQQVAYTQEAYARAANEWPWAGPLFLETSQPGEPTDHPHVGFDLAAPLALAQPTGLLPGTYAAQALGAAAHFEGGWEFSELGADIPQEEPASLAVSFMGSSLRATVRRADYRAYLYVAVDGQPANALPQDGNGNAYLVLTSPDLQPRVESLALAAGLPPGRHTAVIRPDRGWDQWALTAITVGPNVSPPDFTGAVYILGTLGFLSLLLGGAYGIFLTGASGTTTARPASRLREGAQLALAGLVSGVLWASAWLTWGENAANAFRKYGDTLPLLVTLATAGLLYFSPFLLLTLASMAALLALFYLRPALALPLIAFFAPFYLIPRPLFDRAFSMVEIITVLGLAALVLRLMPLALAGLKRRLAAAGAAEQAATDSDGQARRAALGLSALDYAVAGFALACLVSIIGAEIRGVAIREFRVIVLEPALFYALLRAGIAFDNQAADSPAGRWIGWRVVDLFILGAVVVALIGLGNLVTGQNLITAEGGVARIRSVFGSPNNLGLYLGRAIPVAAAIAVLGAHRPRRAAYALALAPLLAAATLSFSRGALLLGIPASLATIALFWGGRRAAIALGGLAAAGAAALVPLSQHPRFANLLSTSSGTGFFRLNVWRSAWAMFTEHPLLGVGPDNFLYAYRGRFIQPEAWQEPNLPHAHNILLDALSRTGLLGAAALAAMLLAFATTMARALRAARNNADLRALLVGLLASMVNTLAHGMVDTAYWFVDLSFVWMMTLGLVAALRGTLSERTPG